MPGIAAGSSERRHKSESEILLIAVSNGVIEKQIKLTSLHRTTTPFHGESKVQEYECSMAEHLHSSFAFYLEIVDDLDVGFETDYFRENVHFPFLGQNPKSTTTAKP